MLKRNLTIILLITLLVSTSIAQDSQMTGLTVRSNPEGALVELKGDVTVTAITPTTIRYPYVGLFRLTVGKVGFEDYRTTIKVDPTRHFALDVKLTRKTAMRAAARSLFIPGWGQRYTDQKTKGFLFTALAIGAGIGYLIADSDFDEKFDEYELVKSGYQTALLNGASQVELSRRLTSLNEHKLDAYDAETVRRITIGSVAAVWGLNLLDALFFTPTTTGALNVKGLTITPTANMQNIGISLAASF